MKLSNQDGKDPIYRIFISPRHRGLYRIILNPQDRLILLGYYGLIKGYKVCELRWVQQANKRQSEVLLLKSQSDEKLRYRTSCPTKGPLLLCCGTRTSLPSQQPANLRVKSYCPLGIKKRISRQSGSVKYFSRFYSKAELKT